MSYEYDQYLHEHISNVQKGLRWMLDNLALNQTQINAVEEAMARQHDASKTSKEEYEAYDDYFYGGNRSYKVDLNFDYAWLHHIHKNPHHWQYWILMEDDPAAGIPYKALPMPLTFIFEMIADWWTFSWKAENLMEIFKWYGEHQHRIVFHEQTGAIVEDILKKMWKVLVLLEVRNGKDQDELEKQYISYWMEEPIEHHRSMKEAAFWGKDKPPVPTVIEHSDTEDNEDLYGVPELKKFPMPDKKHVKSAIRFFNYVDPKYEKELAEAILEKAEEFGLNLESDISVGDENRFKKYLQEDTE